MKTKMRLNFFRLFFVIMLMVAFLQNSFAVDIVGFTLGTGTNGAATSGLAINYPGMGRTLTADGLTSTGYTTTNGLTGAGWDNNGTDGFKTNAFSAVGYLATAVGGQIKGAAKGPKYLKAQYSLNGSTWTNVPNHPSYSDDNPEITVTTTFVPYKFRLPAECDNNSTIYVRWVQNGTTSIDNTTVETTGTISMKSVVMQSDEFGAPTSQSTQITIVSLAPTTITIGCTPGSGNRRYIVINTTNSFTTPDDNFLPTANATYSGTGEQIIYVGSGAVSTVNVPSSQNTYWFRYYEYNQLDELTRFCTIDASASKNPKMCALPNIHTPTHSFGLIRATLGATIDQVSGDVGEIMDRGIIWDVESGVTESKYTDFISQGEASSGTYTLDTEVTRGTTIYYRGYAENESGVILSTESSFSNVPVFSGTGTWETAALWNVQEVPGANGDVTYGSVDDSPIINGICELGATNNVTNLTINSAKKLTINKGVKMKVDGTLTNNAGTSGILIKSIDIASDVSANGSLIFANGTPQGTVEMFSKASWNTANIEGSRYKWQFFGIPITTLSYNSAFNFLGCYVRKWAENSTDYYDAWVRDNSNNILQLGQGATLTAGLGYELVQENNRKYSFAGTLVHSDFSQSLPYTSSAYFKGQSVLGNPYTAAMDISAMVFGANTEAAVYTYNTGTYNEWLSANAQYDPGTGPGTYTVTTKGAGGLTGVLTQIPSMQGFIVKSTNVAGGSVSFPYASLIQNTEKQKAKASSKIGCTIDVIGAHYSDRMWILDDENCTTSFDNGYDGKKMLGSALASQLYGIQDNEPYQIQAVKGLNDTYLGFQPGTDTSFKLVFNHQNLDTKYTKLYLFDLVANQTADITATGSEYSFTSTASDLVKRFKIIANIGITTSIIESKNDNLIFFNQENKLIIDCKLAETGNLQLFDLAGKLQSQFKFAGNAITTLDTNLQKGIYIARLSVGSIEIAQRVIIK